jgi:hypothetical protein
LRGTFSKSPSADCTAAATSPEDGSVLVAGGLPVVVGFVGVVAVAGSAAAGELVDGDAAGSAARDAAAEPQPASRISDSVRASG